LGAGGEAEGSLYVDDGEALEPEEWLKIGFKVGGGKLDVDVEGSHKDTNALGNVTVMGVFGGVEDVKLNDEVVGKDKIQYSEDDGVLRLIGLNNMTEGGAWKDGWTLSW
jgi:alpha-glucosidase